MAEAQKALSRSTLLLGLAGLLPQVAACAVAFTYSDLAMYALVSGFAYSALIFSFIGGVWWGQALAYPARHAWIFVAAVCPSLISWFAALLMFLNLSYWPYAVGAVATGLLFSPLIDLQISKVLAQPQGWMRLRWTLSIGLGCLTLIMAILSLNAIFRF
jgi:Protein of unknown function (DUF3429)